MHQLWHPLEVMADLGQGGFWAALPLAQLVKEPTTDPVAVFFDYSGHHADCAAAGGAAADARNPSA